MFWRKMTALTLRLLEAAAGLRRMKFSGLPGNERARADADVEVEVLAHRHDRAEVREALALERRRQLGVGLVLGLGRDRAEQADLVLFEQLDGAVGQGVALLDQKSQPMSPWT